MDNDAHTVNEDSATATSDPQIEDSVSSDGTGGDVAQGTESLADSSGVVPPADLAPEGESEDSGFTPTKFADPDPDVDDEPIPLPTYNAPPRPHAVWASNRAKLMSRIATYADIPPIPTVNYMSDDEIREYVSWLAYADATGSAHPAWNDRWLDDYRDYTDAVAAAAANTDNTPTEDN